MEDNHDEIWCIVANIKREIPYGPGVSEIKSGLKKFKAGARVSIVGAYRGTCESLLVIGQERNTGKYINLVIRADKIENMRVKKIFRPKTIEFLKTFKPEGAWMLKTKEDAESFFKEIPVWVKDL